MGFIVPSQGVNVTTKGDLQGYNVAPARVPVGADGLFLKANSLQALGVEWAAAGAAGANTYEFIFALGATASVQQVITTFSPASAAVFSTLPMAFRIPVNMTLTDIAWIIGSSSAAAAATARVQIRTETPPLLVQHVLGGGVLKGACDLVTAAAAPARYYRAATATGLSGALVAGDIVFCDLSQVGFWTLTDQIIVARCSVP